LQLFQLPLEDSLLLKQVAIFIVEELISIVNRRHPLSEVGDPLLAGREMFFRIR
jgi:hypothetical protein